MIVSKPTSETERGWEQFNFRIRPSDAARVDTVIKERGMKKQEAGTEMVTDWLKRKESRT